MGYCGREAFCGHLCSVKHKSYHEEILFIRLLSLLHNYFHVYTSVHSFLKYSLFTNCNRNVPQGTLSAEYGRIM